jgi:hypothetical protein
LYPAILFIALKSIYQTDSITGALIFGILYFLLLKFVVRLTFKPADIVVASALFYVLSPGTFLSLPPGGSKMSIQATHTLIFGVVFAFLRATFPQYY